METDQETNKIDIEHDSLRNLNTTRKWTLFLSVLGFIFLGLMIVIGILAGTFLSAFSTPETKMKMPEWLFFIVFFVLALINFFPMFFLFRFSRHAGIAVSTFDKTEMHHALRNLKSFFTYLGIMTIVVLTIYVLILVFLGTTMAFLKR